MGRRGLRILRELGLDVSRLSAQLAPCSKAPGSCAILPSWAFQLKSLLWPPSFWACSPGCVMTSGPKASGWAMTKVPRPANRCPRATTGQPYQCLGSRGQVDVRAPQPHRGSPGRPVASSALARAARTRQCPAGPAQVPRGSSGIPKGGAAKCSTALLRTGNTYASIYVKLGNYMQHLTTSNVQYMGHHS